MSLVVSEPSSTFDDDRDSIGSNASTLSENASLQFDIEGELCGYLSKKTSRDGRWQKRYFKTHGSFLTYYKSRKMEKLLAALSLPQVGNIQAITIDQDPEKKGGLFSLELDSRCYTLRAKTDEDAKEWVTLLQTKKQQNATQPLSINPMLMTAGPGANSIDSRGSWLKEDQKKKSCCILM
jgi:hypothetical protein